MKPVKIAVEGFMSFRTKQEISFAGLELFAISGPTGSGKSSILDAMMYALYGQIPRLGGQGYQEIISHGSARLAVTLDFEVRGRLYRAVRALARGGQTTTQLVELDPETGSELQPLADKVREVDRCVEEMLGLDYQTFAQAVVLPQGDFQRFLKAAPKDRRNMLSGLLRLGRYELMRKAAQKRHDGAADKADTAERRLTEDFVGVDESAIESMTQKFVALTTRVADLHAKVEESERTLQETREVAKAAGELESKRAEKQILAARCGAMDAERARLAAAYQAALLRDVFENLRRAESAAATAREREQTAVAVLDEATTQRQTAAAAVAVATEAAEEGPDLAEKIGDLQRIIGVQSALAETKKRLADAERDASEAEATLAATRERLIAAKAKSIASREKREEEKAAIDSVGYAAERAQWLRDLVDAARAVVEQTKERNQAKADLGEELKKRLAREEAADVARGNLTLANEAHVDARDRALEATEARRTEERRNHAVLLRKSLAPGDSCPVCELPVEKPPPIPTGAEKALEKAVALANEAIERKETARNAVTGAKQKLAKAETALEETADRVAELENRHANAEKTVGVLAATLAKDARKANIEPPLPTDASAIIEEERDLARRQSKWQKAQDAYRNAERAAEEAQTAEGQLSSDEVNQVTALAQSRKRQEDAEAVRDAQEAEVRAVAGEEDPKTLREKLQTRLDELRAKVAATGREYTDADTAVRLADAEHELATSAVAATKAQEDELSATVSARVKDAGFATEMEARSAALDAAAIDGIERVVHEYDGACEVVGREIAALVQQLGDRSATPDDVRQRENAKGVATREHETALADRAALETRLSRAKQDLAKATSLRTDLAAARAEVEVYGTLARELQNDKFLEYLLIESLRKLVTGASVRLRGLSDRYSLDARDSDFYVVDHENASEQRSVDTLSGGETFLASLALALELSAQIQATVGAVQLDSIFIDEGFGTLDPETLETVAGAIESLPHAGRMVGIITHVAELTERMPARIAVVKGPDGSQIRIGAGDAASS